MRFDDRLLTVLNQPASDRRDVAVRWRQLVDLVARGGADSRSAMVEQAIESIRRDAPDVNRDLRAAAARAVAALPLPLHLLEYFASEELAVAAPVLAAATLEPAQWRAIIGAAQEETRRFIETLHPDLRTGEGSVAEPAPPPSPPDSAPAPTPSLHDVVERIEQRRRTRAALGPGKASPGHGEGSPALFRWECSPAGDIAWVDGMPRGAVIGRSISRAIDGDRIDPDVGRAFALRAPFRDATLSVSGQGPLSGDWKISGVPAFAPGDGRFAGYRGIALREREDAADEGQVKQLISDPDSLRELVHELKTPLNAIIGFAEIIDGQYLGPADQRYRERAREIVRQARLLVTAIDDLDFAAKVHSPAAARRRVDIGELLERMTPALKEIALARDAEIDVILPRTETVAEMEPELAERLIYRMCSAVIGQANPTERLRIAVTPGDRVRVCLSRPASLASASQEELLGSPADLDHGFSLRLVGGLARLAGAELAAPEGSIALLFPWS